MATRKKADGTDEVIADPVESVTTAETQAQAVADIVKPDKFKDIASALYELLDSIDAANNAPVPASAKVALVYNAAVKAAAERKQYGIPGSDGIIWN